MAVSRSRSGKITEPYPDVSQPRFVFRIDEFTESRNFDPEHDNDGKWIPSTTPGANVRRADKGVTGKWWYCDREEIRRLKGWSPPPNRATYKTFSTIYSGGHGFHVMEGDATSPRPADTWQHLWFNWDQQNYSSALTNAGQHRTLRFQDPRARWPSMLLPDIYHSTTYAANGVGGLTGELAIFLALIAFSMKPERLLAELPRMMEDGEWQEHSRSNGRMFGNRSHFEMGVTNNLRRH